MDKENYKSEISLVNNHWWFVSRILILKNILDKFIETVKKFYIC